MVGAYNDDDRGVNAGAAYALLHDGDEWAVEDKLVAAEGASFDLFGTSVAISGDTLVIGAPQNEDTDQEAVSNEGLAVVFERSLETGRWFESAVLRPGGPSADHRFGIDVAVKGDTIVVGASHSDAGLLNSGAAHVFARRGRDWFEAERYVAATPQAFDYLGLSVAASERAIVVGVPGANGTAVGTGAIDVLPTGAPRSSWAATFCHSNVRVEGFANMGGTPNPDGLLGRLSAVGSPSVARGDLGLRATNLPLGHLAAVYLGVTTSTMRVRGAEFCIGTQTLLVHYGFRAIGPDRRYVVRDPLGKLETVLPGTMAPLMGETMYAQALYYDPSGGRFFTSNALSFQVEP